MLSDIIVCPCLYYLCCICILYICIYIRMYTRTCQHKLHHVFSVFLFFKSFVQHIIAYSRFCKLTECAQQLVLVLVLVALQKRRYQH